MSDLANGLSTCDLDLLQWDTNECMHLQMFIYNSIEMFASSILVERVDKLSFDKYQVQDCDRSSMLMCFN